jgi:succinate dehydrogenase/fumarate reductase-like Fe-S protein
MVTIHIMGKAYKVPKILTIITAMEYAGYQLRRGVGCREGFCGACATIYRVGTDYKLKTGLACQTMVEDEMYLAQIPFVPAQRPLYELNKLKPSVATFQQLYPETFRCVSCNTCTKACPQELQVMDYVQACIKGDIPQAADLSFDCILCGLCAARCPAEIAQYHDAILARRLYGKYLAPRSEHLSNRLAEMKAGTFDQELKKLMQATRAELEQLYKARVIEPE